MSQNLQNFVKFQKFQLENLVDFEKCCKTHIFLQKSEPIQPKTSNILPKFCQPTLSDVSAGCASSGSSAMRPALRIDASESADVRRRRQRASVGKISAKCCSFSAVAAPIFARNEYKVAGLSDPKNKDPPLSPREALCLFRWCFAMSW